MCRQAKQAAKICFVGLAAESFFVFCMAVYFGCCIGFSLLGGMQLCMVGLIFFGGMRAVWIPFAFAAIRARVHPDTESFYYFDGVGRYGYAIGLQSLCSLMRLGTGILWLPGAACILFARAAYAEDFGVASLILCLCGGLLWVCAAAATGMIWHRIRLWKRKKIA